MFERMNGKCKFKILVHIYNDREFLFCTHCNFSPLILLKKNLNFLEIPIMVPECQNRSTGNRVVTARTCSNFNAQGLQHAITSHLDHDGHNFYDNFHNFKRLHWFRS